MRTIKASEVRKGMRVRVEHERGGATQTLEGVVDDSRSSNFGDGWYIRVGNLLHANVSPDHPVTVLAEPEPEWVEGAWYRCRIGENEPENLRRLSHGWTPFHDTERVYHVDDDPDITVLGRVLIVDWPGDDVARDIERHGTSAPIRFVSALLDKVADAIRTQGGVR